MTETLNRYTFIAGVMFLASAFAFGCTTIEIEEADAFDNHKTVTPASFSSSYLTHTELTIPTVDDEKINAWWLHREDAEFTILYSGGNGFLLVKSLPWIQAWEELPVNILLFDYRGYGLSTGTPTVDGIMTDSDAVFQFAIDSLGVDSDRIIFHGHSMGSFVASRTAETHGAAALILESPITEPQSWGRMMIPWLLRPFIRVRFDDNIAGQSNLDRIRNIDMPLLIITGDDDQITPSRMARELFDESPSQQKKILKIKNGGHNNLPKKREYRSALADFIEGLSSAEN